MTNATITITTEITRNSQMQIIAKVTRIQLKSVVGVEMNFTVRESAISREVAELQQSFNVVKIARRETETTLSWK